MLGRLRDDLFHSHSVWPSYIVDFQSSLPLEGTFEIRFLPQNLKVSRHLKRREAVQLSEQAHIVSSTH